MRIHFIAIGGAIMHNLAIVLRRKGHTVTGSDDKITDPAKTNLEKEGIMPTEIGFNANNITSDIEAVILGMHAREDNPELLKAQQLGLKIYSFPDYIYEVSKSKHRVVIAGSHGKTTITSMVMHVLKENGKDFDYIVGAKVPGFETGVRLSEDAPVIVLEGDEYLASPIHREPKFLSYKPHTALISGVAWDHINVFPDYDEYVKQFERLAYSVEQWGFLTWFGDDEELKRIFNGFDGKVRVRPYYTPDYAIKNGVVYLETDSGNFALKVFGQHNLQNIAGAKNICNELGITDENFYKAISTFTGAANRLHLLGQNDHSAVYRDFAHSPSKLRATVNAVKEQFADRELVAVMELHTFSSLNKEFIEEYKHTMDEADVAVVFYDKETFAHKKMPLLDEAFVRDAFANEGLHIFTDKASLEQFLLNRAWKNSTLLLMTSGNFAGLDVSKLTAKVLS